MQTYSTQTRIAIRRPRRAFTLIELILVIVILGILAALVIPKFASINETSRAEALSVSVRHVRELVSLKAAVGNGPAAPSGYHLEIAESWFLVGTLPKHTWTNSPLVVETVAGAVDGIYPAVKVFNPADHGAANAWYNTTNGRFCVRVSPGEDDAATLEWFNAANSADVTTLDQTGW